MMSYQFQTHYYDESKQKHKISNASLLRISPCRNSTVITSHERKHFLKKHRCKLEHDNYSYTLAKHAEA